MIIFAEVVQGALDKIFQKHRKKRWFHDFLQCGCECLKTLRNIKFLLKIVFTKNVSNESKVLGHPVEGLLEELGSIYEDICVWKSKFWYVHFLLLQIRSQYEKSTLILEVISPVNKETDAVFDFNSNAKSVVHVVQAKAKITKMGNKCGRWPL